MLWKCFEQSWVSWAHSRHNFRALECGVEGNFGALQSHRGTVEDCLPATKAGNGKGGQADIGKTMNTSIGRIALNDRLGKTVDGGEPVGDDALWTQTCMCLRAAVTAKP